MIRPVTALLAGMLFACGLGVARLTLPQTIQDGLDLFGHWRPNMFVSLGVGMAVFGLFRLLVRGRPAPLLADRFRLPVQGWPSAKMIWGAALFGAAWAYSGICPGPSLTASLTSFPVAMFALAMLGGVAAYERLSR